MSEQEKKTLSENATEKITSETSKPSNYTLSENCAHLKLSET